MPRSRRGSRRRSGPYRAWLVGKLEAFDEPVDPVGHDWGGGRVLGVAMTRPDLLRSWASDAVALDDPECAWRALAAVARPAACAPAVEKLADADGPAPAPTTRASAPATASVPPTRGGPDADVDLRDLADRADTDTRRHVRRLRGRINQAAAQALVLG